MKILIVEDDLEISKLLADFLQGNGYEVLCQYDGLHVLDCIQEHQIDLILLDIMLPYRSGDSIIGTFVTKGALASIGIVVMVIASQFAMCLLPFFFAFIFRDIGKSMAVPMVLFFLMVFLMNGDQAQFISQILPMGQLRLMALQQSNISGGQFMFSDFLWVLALCLGTYLWFRRSDLK